jgi:hypothetical protein
MFLRNVYSYNSHGELRSQKTTFFIVTAVKTSNLMQYVDSGGWLIANNELQVVKEGAIVV